MNKLKNNEICIISYKGQRKHDKSLTKKKKKTKTEALNAKSGQEKYQDEYKININRYQMTL